MDSTTNKISNFIPRVGVLAASATAALVTATPALSATLDLAMPFARRDIALGGALILLVAWLAVRLMRDNDPDHSQTLSTADSLSASPDLRWWRNPEL